MSNEKNSKNSTNKYEFFQSKYEALFRSAKMTPLSYLGGGSYSHVFLVQHMSSRQKFAFKVNEVDLVQYENEGLPPSHLVELDILLRTAHPNLARAWNPVVFKQSSVNKAFITYRMSRAHCNLTEFIHSSEKESMSAKALASFMRQCLQGVHALHSNNLVHRDLKPDNILVYRQPTDKDVCCQFQPRIADFNLSLSTGAEERTSYEVGWRTTSAVTAPYRAPEIAMGGDDSAFFVKYGTKSDIWSLGLIFLEILSGIPECDAYVSENMPAEQVMRCYNDMLGPIPRNTRAQYIRHHLGFAQQASQVPQVREYHQRFINFFRDQDVMSSLSHNNISAVSSGRRLMQRQSSQEFKESEEVFDSKEKLLLFDMISRCLQFDPEKRASAEELLQHPFWVFMDENYEADAVIDDGHRSFLQRTAFVSASEQSVALLTNMSENRQHAVRSILTILKPFFHSPERKKLAACACILSMDLLDRFLLSCKDPSTFQMWTGKNGWPLLCEAAIAVSCKCLGLPVTRSSPDQLAEATLLNYLEFRVMAPNALTFCEQQQMLPEFETEAAFFETTKNAMLRLLQEPWLILSPSSLDSHGCFDLFQTI